MKNCKREELILEINNLFLTHTRKEIREIFKVKYNFSDNYVYNLLAFTDCTERKKIFYKENKDILKRDKFLKKIYLDNGEEYLKNYIKENYNYSNVHYYRVIKRIIPNFKTEKEIIILENLKKNEKVNTAEEDLFLKIIDSLKIKDKSKRIDFINSK